MNKDLREILIERDDLYERQNSGLSDLEHHRDRQSFVTANEGDESISEEVPEQRAGWRQLIREQSLLLIWNITWLLLIYFMVYFQKGQLKCSDGLQFWLELTFYFYAVGLIAEMMSFLTSCCLNLENAAMFRVFLVAITMLYGSGVFVYGFYKSFTLQEEFYCEQAGSQNKNAENLIIAQLVIGWLGAILSTICCCLMGFTFLRLFFGKPEQDQD